MRPSNPLRKQARQGRRVLLCHEFLLRKKSKLKNGKDAVFQQIPCARKRCAFAMAIRYGFRL
jgi:hypothetical protein